MGRPDTAVSRALDVALIGATVVVAGLVGLIAFTFFSSVGERYPFLDVHNKSGRPLLIERADLVRSPGVEGPSLLAWRTTEWWSADSHGCEEELLEARDAQGTVVARRTGACSSDTWSITGDGLPAAPRYTRERTPSNTVEVRLVLDPQQQKGSAIAWWRALPQTLELAATAGSAAGVSVHGPYLEDDELTMYLRGPGAASVLAFARSHVLRPAPLTASAYVSAPGEPAPQTATPVVLTITTASTTAS